MFLCVKRCSFHGRLYYPSTLEILRWRRFDWQLIWVGNQLLRPACSLQQPPSDPHPLPPPPDWCTTKPARFKIYSNTSKPESTWRFLRSYVSDQRRVTEVVCLFAARLSACRSRSFGTTSSLTSDLRRPAACSTCSDVPFVQPFCTLQLFSVCFFFIVTQFVMSHRKALHE